MIATRARAARLLALAGVLAAALLAAVAAGEERPAVLVHSPRGLDGWWVDLAYLAELRERGFEVDYTDDPGDLDWARLQQYNVLVLFSSVDNPHFFPPRVHGQRQRFLALVERFLQAGGGVLLMTQTHNGDEYVRSLIEPWDARIPFEQLREADGKLRAMPRMRGHEQLASTRQVAPSPVSEGVEQVWYPLFDLYNAGATSPIQVGDAWQVVLRGAPTSYTVPVDPGRTGRPAPPDPLVRRGGVREPALFAIRSRGPGRIAFCAMWPQFSLGQGTRWLYERRVLDAGFPGAPSDFGRLLENSFRWLAEPSLAGGAPGGYVTRPERLLPKNERPEVRRLSPEPQWRSGQHDDERRDDWKPFRGLLGARSALGSGKGSVAEYAAAAKAAGLDFLVFLEDSRSLTPARLDRLKAECREHSDASLRLLPGYVIDDNIGSHLFLFGDSVVLPPEEVLLGERLNLQYRNPATGKPEARAVVLDWILARRGDWTNVGYYRFLDDPHSQKLPDLRVYSMAALRTYAGGRLLEDVTDDYLLTAQGTLPPAPVSVNLVESPAELAEAVGSGQSLTWARARGLAEIFEDALAWAYQYVSPHVFVSDGPLIHSWPNTYRVWTYAAENFVTGSSQMPARLHVSSDLGLRELRILDGTRLFRRFLPGGARDLDLVLELDGTLHRNLVVVAEDLEGGRAVSYARRSWKESAAAVAFCGDRVNDCPNARLGRGPGTFLSLRNPPIAGGETWDGGPVGVRPLVHAPNAQPVLVSDRGQEGPPLRNVPLLDVADEGVVSVRARHDRRYAPGTPVGNAWTLYGPHEPSQLVDYELRFTEFARPGVGPHPSGLHGWADERGALASVFENDLRFKQDLEVESLEILSSIWVEAPGPVKAVFGGGGQPETATLWPARRSPFVRRLATGEWMGLWSEAAANHVFLWNRGEALVFSAYANASSITVRLDADLAGREVERGERHRFELFEVVDPVDAAPRDAARFARLAAYFASPDGLAIARGRRLPGDGVLEIQAEGGAAELRIGRPSPPLEAPLPVRVLGLEPRWSAGFYQIAGHNTSYYPGGSENRYRPAAVDEAGGAWASLFPDHAPLTHVVIGHPVVSDRPQLFVQVTQRNASLSPRRSSWHVSVNNPTDQALTATFRQAMDLPGFRFEETTRTVPAGGYLVLAD